MNRLTMWSWMLLLLSDATFAEPPIWVVEQGQAKVFLFGAGPPSRDTTWVSPKIEGALTSSDSFWRETPDQESQGPNPIMLQLGLDPGALLSKKLAPADTTRLAAIAASLNLEMNRLESMRPWLAAQMLSGRQLSNAGFSPEMTADRILTDIAKSRGKPIHAEYSSTEDLLRFFGNMPEPLATDFLTMTLDGFDGPAGDPERLLGEWLDGKLALQEEMVDDLKSCYPKLYAYLGESRNDAWVTRIEKMLETPGATFVVVGINHLVGSDSILEKLRTRGMSARLY